MSNTDAITTGTPCIVASLPAARMRWVRGGALMAPFAAPVHGTGLPAVAVVGAAFGTGTATYLPTTIGVAVLGAPGERFRTTPGDLPPDDPLS